MKKIIFSFLSIGAIILTACSNSGSKNKQAGRDMNTVNKETTPQAIVTGDQLAKTTAAKYNTGRDSGVTASVRKIADHYLQIKNALAKDNESEAASAAKAMHRSINKPDKSLFTAEQKAFYDEHAESFKNKQTILQRMLIKSGSNGHSLH